MYKSPKIRVASHAGTWYTADTTQLIQNMEDWRSQSNANSLSPSRFGIGPHAGYSYCGQVLAECYVALGRYNTQVAKINRVVLMGPTHVKYFRGIQTTNFAIFDTPLGPVTVDSLAKTLQTEHQISALDLDTDVQEHSWEMHLPFIKQTFEKETVVLPLLFGAEAHQDKRLFETMTNLWSDPHTAFIVSSDFCHWGKRFRYTPFEDSAPLIYRHIEALDTQAFQVLSTGSSKDWEKYLSSTQNTICGAEPIGWLLRLAEIMGQPLSFELLKYKQSSLVRSKTESSVSYAALAAT